MANPEHLAKLKEGVDAWNAWRKEQRDVRPDLSGAPLYYANFGGADFSAANLGGANLAHANLGAANFGAADLSYANLGDADLSYADCGGADLRGAFLYCTNLFGANLRDTNLEGVQLTCADLTSACLVSTSLIGTGFSAAIARGASWGDLDLSAATGLERVEHGGPSTIGVDTLVKSKGRIPEAFLRGCGLSDWQIEEAKLYDPDLSPCEISEIQTRVFELRTRGVIQISPVFISYSHGDGAFVDALGRALDKAGVRYWRDVKDATAGRLDKVIERGMALNPTVLLVLSEHSVKSDWVAHEIESAIRLSKKLKRDVLCPVALDQAWLETDRLPGNMLTQIKQFVVLDFSKWLEGTLFEAQFRKLFDGLGLHYGDAKAKSVAPEPA